MKSLLDAINDVFLEKSKNLPYKSVLEFLKDDGKSADYIRAILNDVDFAVENENQEYPIRKARARHSAITYLLGLVLSDFAGLSDSISNNLSFPYDSSNSFQHLWMLSALYHDWGYFSERINNADIDYQKEVKYYLLTDNYADTRLDILNDYSVKNKNALAYSYVEIEAYDAYARTYHAEQKPKHLEGEKYELVDHGILGGVFKFDDLIRKLLRNNYLFNENELFSIKTACLTIAQHNIFKSPSSSRDAKYGVVLRKLYHDSEFVISKTTPLLLLLSLVDTFECVKAFSRGEVKEGYFQTETVLSCIKIDVSYDQILIDYSELERHARESRSKTAIDVFEKYIKAMEGLERWTCFSFQQNNGQSLIVYNPQNSLALATL